MSGTSSASVFGGSYFDGQSAVARPVQVQLRADGLLLTDTVGNTTQSYTYDRFQVISNKAQPHRVTLRDHGGEGRLVIEGDNIYEQLHALAPGLFHKVRPETRQRVVLALAGTAVVIALLASLYPLLKHRIARNVPHDWAETLGESVVASLPGGNLVCSSPQGQAAMDALVESLLAHSGVDRPVQVRVLNADIANAFAVPGGIILVTDKLIQEAESPDELAGVVAHEIGHVDHYHPMERMVDALGLQVFVGSLTGDVGATAIAVMMLAYSREDEREADVAALRYLRGAQISSEGLARFFERLSEKYGAEERAMAFLSTHPVSKERADMMRDAETPGPFTPSLTDAAWEAVLNMCRDTVWPDEAPADEPLDSTEELHV